MAAGQEALLAREKEETRRRDALDFGGNIYTQNAATRHRITALADPGRRRDRVKGLFQAFGEGRPPPISRYAPSFQPPARRHSNCQRPLSSALATPSTSPMSTRSL
jgi:hypothetical protein